MAAVWDKTLFDLAYAFHAEPDGHPNTREAIQLHYNRYALFPDMLRRAEFFASNFKLTADDNILIIGCGFGWTTEALTSIGIAAVGTDTSSYVSMTKSMNEDVDISAAIIAVGLSPVSGEGLEHFNRIRGDGVRTRATILNEDGNTEFSRIRIQNAFSGNITLIITEDVVTSLSDAECIAFQTQLEKYNVPRICHFVTEFANPNPPFNFNSKSISDWKALFPTSTLVADGYRYGVL